MSFAWRGLEKFRSWNFSEVSTQGSQLLIRDNFVSYVVNNYRALKVGD